VRQYGRLKGRLSYSDSLTSCLSLESWRWLRFSAVETRKINLPFTGFGAKTMAKFQHDEQIQTDRHTYRVAPKWHSLCWTPQLCQILTDFQNSFTVIIRRKFVITLSLKIPPHLKCVAIHYLVKCQKVMVSVGVSRMGRTGIVFVEPGAKVNSEYCCLGSRWRSTTWHPCKMPALVLDPAAGRRTVTHS